MGYISRRRLLRYITLLSFILSISGLWITFFHYQKSRNDIITKPGAGDNIISDKTVHIVTYVTGQRYVNFSLISIKSVLFSTDWYIHFYVMSQDDSATKLKLEIASWPAHRQHQVTIVPVTLNCSVLSQVATFTNLRNREVKICVFETLVSSPAILDRTNKVLYMDSDIVAFDDISHLWHVFEEFGPQHTIGSAIALKYRGKKFAEPRVDIFRDNYGLNAGMMLMHLENLRRASFVEGLMASSALHREPLINNDDQDLLCLYFCLRPEENYPLSCDWNFLRPMYGCSYDVPVHCREAEEYGIRLYHDTTIVNHKLSGAIFNGLIDCLANIDFYQPAKAKQCLQESIDMFKNSNCSFQNSSHKLLTKLEHKLSTM